MRSLSSKFQKTMQPIIRRSSSKKLNKVMVMEYCISDDQIKDENPRLNCWLCDKLGSNEEIFIYNTIFNSPIKLHKHCFDICSSSRNKLRQPHADISLNKDEPKEETSHRFLLF